MWPHQPAEVHRIPYRVLDEQPHFTLQVFTQLHFLPSMDRIDLFIEYIHFKHLLYWNYLAILRRSLLLQHGHCLGLS